MKVLFICNEGKDRSKKASELWKKNYLEDEVKYFGINVEKDPIKYLNWADKIYLMEKSQYEKIEDISSNIDLKKKVNILNIEDIYNYGDLKLEKLLKEKLNLF